MFVDERLHRYVEAMQKASGLNPFDVVTSVLFAVATHLDLEQYPILVYLGAMGTGKSEAMKQLYPMCRNPAWIRGSTMPAHRRAIIGKRTAFVEEADGFHADLIDLYTRRYSRQTGSVEVNEPVRGGNWELKTYNIFGATVMHRRVSLDDVALRSRSIIIRTTYRLENYERNERIGDVSAIASEIGAKVQGNIQKIGGVDRVWQTWSPLVEIAKELGMTDWVKEAMEVIAREAEVLRGGQGYEPSEAILQAIDILSRNAASMEREDKSVRISAVVDVVRDEFALNLKHHQIKEEAEARGFESGTLHGYPIIKVKKELLDTLLPE